MSSSQERQAQARLKRVLLVDSDAETRNAVTGCLEQEGLHVMGIGSGSDALAHVQTFGLPDLLLIDLLLPDRDGFEVAIELRRIGTFPIVCLSAINDVDQIAASIDTFADDFIIKPYQPEELIARLKRILQQREKDLTDAIDTIVDSHLQINLYKRYVVINNKKCWLTPIEARLLQTFLQHRGQTLTPAELISSVWHDSNKGSFGAIAVHVHRLRHKLRNGSDESRYILNIRGEGYQFID